MQVVFGLLALGLVIFIATREPKRPSLPRWESQKELLDDAVEDAKVKQRRSADAELVRGLLQEDLSSRRFDFAVVAEAVSGKRVIPLKGRDSGERVASSILGVMNDLLVELNADDSPVKGLRRINEGSRFFEDGLLERLSVLDGISCEIPQTREGSAQRSGYPDLKVTDEATGGCVLP